MLPTPLQGEARHGSPGQHRTRGDTMLTGTVLNLLPTPSVGDGSGGHTSRSGDRKEELLLGGIAQGLPLLSSPRASDGGPRGQLSRLRAA